MTTLSKAEITTFLTEQYRLWSENKIDEMMALFSEIAPNGYTIEYVGQGPIDGPKGMADMIAEHAGKIRTDIVHLFVNGNEAAAVINNVVNETGAVMPSVDTYRFEDGTLAARYFH